MDNNELFSAGMGYMTGQSIANNMASKNQQLRTEIEESKERLKNFLELYPTEEMISKSIADSILSGKKEEAYEYLNSHLRGELIDSATRQEHWQLKLEERIPDRINKYRPFYERLSMPIPEEITGLTAKSLCDILGIKVLSDEERKEKLDKYLAEKYPKKDNNGSSYGWIAVVFLIVMVLAILYICAVAL